MSQFRQGILLVFFLSFIACTGQDKRAVSQDTKIERVENSSWNQAINQETQAQIVDIRTPEEFEAGHIPGAVNINFYDSDFLQKVGTLQKDKTLYIYCKSGGRSGNALIKLKGKGFSHIVELKTGYMNWSE